MSPFSYIADSQLPAIAKRTGAEIAQDVSKSDVLRALLEAAGIEPALIEGDEIKNRLRANVDEAVSRGAFGLPTFFVSDEMFWGNDRLDFVEEAATRPA